MMIKNQHGVAINFEAAKNRMDKKIREDVQAKLGKCDETALFVEYCRCHRAAFGKEFGPNMPDAKC